MKTYRDLIVWQKAMDLVEFCYQVSGSFPTSEVYGLTAQMRRSAVSVPSNIAEGYGRHHSKDYARFLQMAAGSLYELQTQLEIAKRLGYLPSETFEHVSSMGFEIEKMLASLISKVQESIK
ncbi:MAG: four helix bundle protein [Breznakibacter sp.]